MPQARIYLSILINIRCHHPGAGLLVEVKDTAFTNVDTQADVLLTPI